jgi:predicted butyrate kinase (DUF1464 family)
MEMLETTNRHSPSPWCADLENLVVVDVYGNVVADCEVETFEVERASNAEFIAVACNNHYKMTEALKRLVEISAIAYNLKQSGNTNQAEIWAEIFAATKAAQEAIAEIETKQSLFDLAK